MSSRRWLYVLVGGEQGGVAVVWKRLARAMVAEGELVEAAFLADGGGIQRDLSEVGVQTFRVPGYRLVREGQVGPLRRAVSIGLGLVGQLGALKHLTRSLRHGGYEAVLMQSPRELLLIGVAGRLAGLPVLWLMPTVLSGRYWGVNQFLYRVLLRLTGVVPLPNSKATNDSLGGRSSSRTILSLGVSPEEFDDRLFKVKGMVLREELGIGDETVLAVLGRIEPSKGQLRLVEAVGALALERRAQCALIFCGEVDDQEYLNTIERRAAALGMTAQLHVVPPVSDVRTVIAASDALCSVSLVTESFGLTLVEAMSMRRPVIALGRGGPLDIVVDGVSGWLWVPEEESLTSLLERVLSCEADWPSMGESARERVRRFFDVSHTVQSLLSLSSAGVQTRGGAW